MATALKLTHAALGLVPTGVTVPVKPCLALSPGESARCYLALGHSAATLHTGYSARRDATTTWA